MRASDSQKILKDVHAKHGIIGRDAEILALLACLKSGKNVLLEGPVGVGKTRLIEAVARQIGRGMVRIDGDSRYTEHKLTGWFDPPTVIKKGYTKASYFDGPLASAMREGSVLFINEMNRLPEGVQNVLLPALDERKLDIPRIGTLKAKAGFCVVAAQNPREFVATSHLSEALLDRFELISLTYQSESEEREILRQESSYAQGRNNTLADRCLALVRGTRASSLFKRGASVRAAISVYDLAQDMGGDDAAFESAARIALPTRIELSEEGLEMGVNSAIQQAIDEAKKKSSRP